MEEEKKDFIKNVKKVFEKIENDEVMLTAKEEYLEDVIMEYIDIFF